MNGGPRNERAGMVRVGDRRNGGEVWAAPNSKHPEKVTVGVTHLMSLVVEVDWNDIAELRDGLTELLREAGRE